MIIWSILVMFIWSKKSNFEHIFKIEFGDA